MAVRSRANWARKFGGLRRSSENGPKHRKEKTGERKKEGFYYFEKGSNK
jgi:hypothetical protein